MRGFVVQKEPYQVKMELMDSLVQFGGRALGTVFCLGIVGSAMGSAELPALNTFVGTETITESDRLTM